MFVHFRAEMNINIREYSIVMVVSVSMVASVRNDKMIN